MGRAFKSYARALVIRQKLGRKYKGKFVIKKLYGHYIVKRPSY